MTWKQKTFSATYLSIIYLFLYLPIITLIILSFNRSPRSLLWHGFTWDWYRLLLHDNELIRTTLHSLTLASLAATLATLIGVIVAITFFRYRFAAKKVFFSTILMLIILPDIILGVAFLLLFRTLHLPMGFWSLFIAHTCLCFPFTTITISTQLNQLDRRIIEAAQDLGANDMVLLKSIFIPLLTPSLIASWLLSFVMSFDDVIISYFVAGPSYQILPLKIFSMTKLGISPELNALSSLILISTLIIIITAQLFLKKILWQRRSQ